MRNIIIETQAQLIENSEITAHTLAVKLKGKVGRQAIYDLLARKFEMKLSNYVEILKIINIDLQCFTTILKINIKKEYEKLD